MLLIACVILLALIFAISIPILYWKFRSPTDLNIAESLQIEAYTAVPPDVHHSNTDLIEYKGRYVLAHATSPWHFASRKCRLVLRSSQDGKNWDVLTEIGIPGEDVRDPKLAIIGGRLFLYFLPNTVLEPRPHDTFYCSSDDLVSWTAPQELSIGGWLLWRPRTLDGTTWYAPAYRREHGKVSLFKSTDGVVWSEVCTIYEGQRVTETDIVFRPDGTMLTTARIEMQPTSRWGHHPEGHTLIGIAAAPYTDWTLSRSYETRLDGPCLFQVGERTYACGRRHVDSPEYMGSAWGRKRTSLYLVLPDRLVFLSDLPSCGDTAYAGAVVDGEKVLISYYTSPRGRDYFWLMGMLSNSAIEMAAFGTENLEKLTEEKLAEQPRGPKQS
jgi:hypothetical protein